MIFGVRWYQLILLILFRFLLLLLLLFLLLFLQLLFVHLLLFVVLFFEQRQHSGIGVRGGSRRRLGFALPYASAFEKVFGVRHLEQYLVDLRSCIFQQRGDSVHNATVGRITCLEHIPARRKVAFCRTLQHVLGIEAFADIQVFGARAFSLAPWAARGVFGRIEKDLDGGAPVLPMIYLVQKFEPRVIHMQAEDPGHVWHVRARIWTHPQKRVGHAELS